jgi:hypothetical protein
VKLLDATITAARVHTDSSYCGDSEDFVHITAMYMGYGHGLSYIESTKNPVREFEARCSETGLTTTVGRNCVIEFVASGMRTSANMQFSMVQPLVDHKQEVLETKELYDYIASLETKHTETVKEYLTVKYGEKKIKAQIIKASLMKSEKGRNLISMLQNATNIKLLNK